MAAKKRSLWKIVGVILLILIIVAGVLETSVRYKFGNDIKYVATEQTTQNGQTETTEPTVRFGFSSVLLGVLNNNVSQVKLSVPDTLTITEPDAQGGSPETTGHPAATITAKDIDITDINSPVAKQATIESTIPTDLLKAEIQQQLTPAGNTSPLGSMLTIQELIPDTDRQVFTLVFAGSNARLDVAPVVEDGNLVVNVASAEVMGVDLGKSIQDALTFAFQKRFSLNQYFKFSSAWVTSDGLQVFIDGKNIPVDQLGTIQQGLIQ